MAGTFQAGETIICEATVTNTSGVLTSPSTSMKITIKGTAVNAVNMSPINTGRYTYDFQSNGAMAAGYYDVTYEAIDGSRIVLKKDNFKLE